jgi:hypothetical protein
MSEDGSETEFDEFAELSVPAFEKTMSAKKLEQAELKLQKQQEREQRRQLAEQEKEQKRFYKQQERLIREQEKDAKRSKKTPKSNVSFSISPFNEPKDEDSGDSGDESIFSEHPTEIVGREKMILLAKVSQFKQLFSEKLKSFKIKKNSSVEDLKAYIVEMETIVEVSNIDQFLYDAILQSIKLVEGVSSMTKNYNIKGCADMLKMNPQFQNLCKLLFLKYQVFSAVPIEYQLMMICSTTAFMCMQKNKHKDQINEFLNQKI